MTPEAIAHLAHELRTPISAIMSSAELMGEELFGPLGDPRYKSYVQGIRSSAQHLLEVIESMLANARPEPLTESAAIADLGDIAQVAIESIRTLAESNRTVLALETADGLHVAADPTAVRQMLLNLLANAVRHSGLEATIIVRTGRDRNGCTWIEVEDDGPGLPRAVALLLAGRKPRKPRTGADTSRAMPEPAKGHGFGLAITSAMAKTSGAELAFFSVAPHGTRARLTFRPLPAV